MISLLTSWSLIGRCIGERPCPLLYFLGSSADSRPLYIADIHNAADEKRYNLTTETRDRFLEIARNKYGVSDHPQFGSFDKNRIPMRYLLVWTGRLMLQTCYRLLIIL